ncbi:glycoside hydrolase [Terfezia claveryi]|nr:glycoside hydrolase [Terfezia claveryi]
MDAASPSTLWGSNVYVLPHPHGRRRRGRRRSARQLQRSMSIRPRLLWISLLGIALFYGVFVGGVTASEWSPGSRWSRPRRDGQPYTKARVKELREEVRAMFHHGWDNYMLHAFPADEIKPLTCLPQHRTPPSQPTNLGLNDVLGNYSLTLIDTLSTLAIFSATSDEDKLRFWRGAEELRAHFYPDEILPPAGVGFDLDVRVQVFESTIRILGGLLSAHLFASGEFGGHLLPAPASLQLSPAEITSGKWDWFGRSGGAVRTKGQFAYDGWLLDLAYDLGERLLPAFEVGQAGRWGVPWPRVNLRWGVQNVHARGAGVGKGRGVMKSFGCEGYGFGISTQLRTPRHPPTTCPAGAASLLLEFTLLSRLTSDGRFEEVSKRAFASVWSMRSDINLLSAELDITGENGVQWSQYYSSLGAGIDSFLEYAVRRGQTGKVAPDWFWGVWEVSRKAINRHMLHPHPTPHFLPVHPTTGATILPWVDSLSAFYPGLLALSGEVSAAKMHISSLRRCGEGGGDGDGGSGAEVLGEVWMAGLDNVGTVWGGVRSVGPNGELFPGETLQYLFLLFDDGDGGGLGKDEGPWVFTTEGHPMVIPKWIYQSQQREKTIHKMRRKQTSSSPSSPSSTTPAEKPALCENPHRPRNRPPGGISLHPSTSHAFHFVRTPFHPSSFLRPVS